MGGVKYIFSYEKKEERREDGQTGTTIDVRGKLCGFCLS
jgi:hypothetical protein